MTVTRGRAGQEGRSIEASGWLLALVLGAAVALAAGSACKKESPPSTADETAPAAAGDTVAADTPPGETAPGSSPGAADPGAAAGGGHPHPGAAGDPGAAAAGPGAGAPVPDEKLDQFVAALIQVQKVQKQAEEKLATAKSPEQAQQVQAKASEDMAAAVQLAGLPLAEYSQLAQRISADPQLQTEVENRLRVKQAE
jgi:hypothetical protein